MQVCRFICARPTCMRRRNLSAIVLTGLMLMLAGSPALVSADILYTADFESDIRSITRDRDSYPPLRSSGNSPEIVGAENGITPRGGSHMMKSYLHRYNSNVTYRTEAVAAADQNFTGTFEKGRDYWLGVSIYFPADWSMDYDGIDRNGRPITGSNGIVFQFHDRSYRDDSWRSGLPFIIRHSKDGFIVGVRDSGCRGRPECLNNPDITNTINRFNERAPLLRGQWNDIVMHVKWSPDSDGILNLWINGEEVLNSRGPNYHSEVPANAYPYIKMGNIMAAQAGETKVALGGMSLKELFIMMSYV